VGDAQQRLRMVGQEAPLSHATTLPQRVPEMDYLFPSGSTKSTPSLAGRIAHLWAVLILCRDGVVNGGVRGVGPAA
jgi:hypothetical protein